MKQLMEKPYLYYEKDTDMAELFFKLHDPNCGHFVNEYVTEFRSKVSGEVVGYLFEAASESLIGFPNVSESVKMRLREELEKAEVL